MLILLPPSEGKSPASGPGCLDLDALCFIKQLKASRLSVIKKYGVEILDQPTAPAIDIYSGVLYQALGYHTLTKRAQQRAQSQLLIFSALFGVLRPLDLIQPYRLEMGTPLPNARGKDLYAFWGTQISEYVSQRLKNDSVLVNLASVEYFKAVDTQKARVVNCVFEDFKDGRYKIISIHAKRARGLMARFVIQNRIEDVEDLKGFSDGGYWFSPQLSNENKLVFTR